VVETIRTLRVLSEAAHRQLSVDLVEVNKLTRVARARADRVQRTGTAGRLGAVWMTRQTDAARIGVFGRRTLSHAVRTVLSMSASVALVSSLSHDTTDHCRRPLTAHTHSLSYQSVCLSVCYHHLCTIHSTDVISSFISMPDVLAAIM